MHIEYAPKTTEKDREWMAEIFNRHNAENGVHDGEPESFHFDAKSEDGERIGMLFGALFHDWCKITGLAVDDKYRQQGVGSKLMQKAESLAEERGCVGIVLNTTSYQAGGFYEKHGFEVFGKLPKFSGGKHESIYYKKILQKGV